MLYQENHSFPEVTDNEPWISVAAALAQNQLKPGVESILAEGQPDC